jgi:hypothetical protein
MAKTPAGLSVISRNVMRLIHEKGVSRYTLRKRAGGKVYDQLKGVTLPEVTTLLKWAVAISADVNELVRGVNAEYDAMRDASSVELRTADRDLIRHTSTSLSSSSKMHASQDEDGGHGTRVSDHQKKLNAIARLEQISGSLDSVVSGLQDDSPVDGTRHTKPRPHRVRRAHSRKSA